MDKSILPQVLIVEDDKAVSKLIQLTLDTEGYSYQSVMKGQEALRLLPSGKIDIMLLDLGLPDMDGVEIIRQVRSWSNMPIVVISARSEDQDKIEALDSGADDYLTKPFSVDELLARLRVICRRLNDLRNVPTAESRFCNGALEIDYAAGCVYLQKRELHLTPIEYKLLCLLSRHVGKVLTHRFIMKEVWGSTWYNDVGTLRVYMATLRKKIDARPELGDFIQTHVGIGYRMLRHENDESGDCGESGEPAHGKS